MAEEAAASEAEVLAAETAEVSAAVRVREVLAVIITIITTFPISAGVGAGVPDAITAAEDVSDRSLHRYSLLYFYCFSLYICCFLQAKW